MGFPRFQGQVDQGQAKTTRLSSLTNPTRTRRRFTAQQTVLALSRETAGAADQGIGQRCLSRGEPLKPAITKLGFGAQGSGPALGC